MFAFHTPKPALIKLKPDEEILYRLPPTSPGPIRIDAFDNYTSRGLHDATVVHGGATAALELELIHQDFSLPGTNHFFYDALFGDDLWRLRVKRISQNGERDYIDEEGRLQYRIETMYPSQLPILERRIAASFFHDGFETNWNEQKYIKVLLNGNIIEISFREDLAQLYDLPVVDNPYLIKLGSISFEPSVEMISQRLDIGAGPLPGASNNVPFFSARLEFPAVKLVHEDLGELLELSAFYMTVRFYLRPANTKLLGYVPVFDTNVELEFGTLLSMVDAVGGPDEKEAVNLFKNAIEEGLYQLQNSGSEGPYVFGKHLTPWLVGGPINMDENFMVNDFFSIGYAPGPGDILRPEGIVEPATGELVVHYIGPHAESDTPVVLDTQLPPSAPTDDGSVRLFDVPDEDPDPIPGQGHGVEPRPLGRKPSIGALGKIDHIVVLMQENRSFDHVLGYLSRDKINPEVDGLFPPDDPRAQQQFNRFHNRNFFPQKADNEDPKRPAVTAWPSFSVPGPAHGNEDVASQMLDNMGHFVENFAKRVGQSSPFLRLVMDYFGPDDLPVYARLAREFGICDHWHCAHAGPTWPNRFVLFTGELSKDPDGTVEFNNSKIRTMVPLQQLTIFDLLNQAKVKWRLFEHNYSFLRFFKNFTFDTTNILPFNDPTGGFETTARMGALPPVTFIEPDYIDVPPGNDDAPPGDMAYGQDLVKRIVKALIDSPTWKRTLLIITYDEHGGFYDHVDPPEDAPPLRGGRRKLGPRVPTFVISPLIERGLEHGQVFHSLFDHTSIGATILRRFVGGPFAPPPHVSPRMDAALDLRDVLTLSEARPAADFAGLFDNLPDAPPAPQNPRTPLVIPAFPDDDFHFLLSAIRLTSGQSPQTAVAQVPATPTPISETDLIAMLAELDKANPVKLNWEVSIVDLLALLNLKSSNKVRKEMAVKLGCPAELMRDSAKMNVFLHQTILKEIAQNGGNIPTELLGYSR